VSVTSLYAMRRSNVRWLASPRITTAQCARCASSASQAPSRPIASISARSAPMSRTRLVLATPRKPSPGDRPCRPSPTSSSAQEHVTHARWATPSRREPRGPRVPLHRRPRRGQDHDRAHPRQGAQLREGPDDRALRRVLACKEIARATTSTCRRSTAPRTTRRGRAAPAGDHPLPALARDRFKIVIVDEVHMLSVGAFNALPEDARGAAAAREVHLRDDRGAQGPHHHPSRCQRYDFRLIPQAIVAGARPKHILAAENDRRPTKRAIAIVSREAAGSMRDALTLLDQVVAFSAAQARRRPRSRAGLGIADREVLHATASAMLDRRRREGAGAGHAQVARARARSVALRSRQLTELLRDLVVLRICGPGTELVAMVEEERRARLRARPSDRAARAPAGVPRHVAPRSRTIAQARSSRASTLEMGLVRLAARPALRPVSELVARLEAIESSLGGRSAGAGPARPAPRAAPREQASRAAAPRRATPSDEPEPEPSPRSLPSPEPPRAPHAAPSPSGPATSPSSAGPATSRSGAGPATSPSSAGPSHMRSGAARPRPARCRRTTSSSPSPSGCRSTRTNETSTRASSSIGTIAAPVDPRASAEPATRPERPTAAQLDECARAAEPPPPARSSAAAPRAAEPPPARPSAPPTPNLPRVGPLDADRARRLGDDGRRARGHQPAHGALLKHAVPRRVGAEVIEIAFPPGSFYGKQAESADAKAAISQVAERRLGGRPRIDVVYEVPGGSGSTLAQLEDERERARPRGDAQGRRSTTPSSRSAARVRDQPWRRRGAGGCRGGGLRTTPPLLSYVTFATGSRECPRVPQIHPDPRVDTRGGLSREDVQRTVRRHITRCASATRRSCTPPRSRGPRRGAVHGHARWPREHLGGGANDGLGR
jgi:DNA polymerase III gamma/tau subunit